MKMICFLTSNIIIPYTNELNPANGFLDRLRECVPHPCSTLFICSDPDSPERMDSYAGAVKSSFEDAGFAFDRFSVLDRRNQADAAALVSSAQLIILAGGHVPTQNRFFAQIDLKGLLRSYGGVLIGISAGSMNSAEVVYAHPELDGEAVDPAFQRYLPGLGLTKRMIIPHYQMIKDDVLDGLRVMEDVAYPDSHGREFLVLVDGSYLYIGGGIERIHGKAYSLAEGRLSQVCAFGDTVEV